MTAAARDTVVDLTQPSEDHAEVTLTADLDITGPYPRAIYVGREGNIKCTTISGRIATYVGLSPGTILPVRVKKIFYDGTTASYLVLMY